MSTRTLYLTLVIKAKRLFCDECEFVSRENGEPRCDLFKELLGWEPYRCIQCFTAERKPE